jgi:addiction module HigA family antidote
MEKSSLHKARAVLHPGHYIRESVLPSKLSVKKAAELLDVGRPALSNLLNGKAALSGEMALRLEKSFGANSEDLLKKQANYDEYLTRERGKQIAVPVYAPGFIQITAAQIEDWADKNLNARHQLPALLRRLVLTTGDGMTKVDFPAFDNAERPGWDGQIETDAATPWIPAGDSGWEFGCNRDVRQKAESDYKARVTSISPAVRQNTTLVFVTPRNWPRTRPTKEAWASAKRAEGKWKDVRVIDASDLEQWLEQSVPAQAWMAERLGQVSSGVISLEESWDRWAKATRPELPKELFGGAIEVNKNTLKNWIAQPSAKPLIVSANSAEEGLAFVAWALEAVSNVTQELPDRAVVLQSIEALKKATTASTRFIAVIDSAEVETALAGLQKVQPTIIIRRRNSAETQPDIALDLIDNNTLRTALKVMGIREEDVPRYVRECGQSASVLRRRLSDVPEIKRPPWSQNNGLAKKLALLGLVGVWNAETKADREILSYLSATTYPTVEDWVTELQQVNQPPVWSAGSYRGVLSKIDVLFGTHHALTKADLERFFFTAHYALAEKDPALELPENDRWAASLYGKSRDHSRALRDGICETLVLLAVHGNHLFEGRLGLNVKALVDHLVRGLLIPLSGETWESQQADLPGYAEAAPEVFLDILETDLASSDPQVLALLRPASSGVFGRCARSGLLWALEILAWDPTRTLRVSRLLARLSEPKIDDNWANKPENSLTSIFRSWVPQTAMKVEDRCKLLEVLAREYPKVIWRLCLQQFDPHASIGHYSARPRWRNDAAGAGQIVTIGERNRTIMKAVEICLGRPKHDEHTLGDLVERLRGLMLEHQAKVWELVCVWISMSPRDEAKAYLRERIRRSTLTRRGRLQGLERAVRDQARAAYDALQPNNVVIRHQWLFAEHWTEESFDEVEEADVDVARWEKKIVAWRTSALQEIWSSTGYHGILRLCEGGNASYIVGRLLTIGIIPNEEAVDFIYRMFKERPSKSVTTDRCVSGFMDGLDENVRDTVLVNLIGRFSSEDAEGEDKKVRLLLGAPFRRSTWLHVRNLPKVLSDKYWKEVNPEWANHDRDELREMITCLIEANRPRAAFHVVQIKPEELEAPVLVRLLTEVATNAAEPVGHYMLQSYEIARALKALDRSSTVSDQQMAQLEFMYLSALGDDDYGIPHLETQLSESPAMFMQAIGLSYKRSDDGEDPPDWRPAGSDDSVSSVATQAFRLLQKARRTPGTKPDGTINVDDLKSWVSEVNGMCKKYARDKVGGHVVGEFLAKCPAGEDGIWPCEPMREALEEVGSREIIEGMVIGIINSRGAVWRGEGGSQERELAAKYRKWSKQVAMEYPATARLLEDIAMHYDYDAKWHDTRADVDRRVGY